MMFGKKTRVGFDLGSYALKIAAREARSEHCYLWSEVIHPERQGAEDDLEYRFYGERLRELVDRARDEMPVFNRSVVASIEGEGVFYGYLEFPSLSPKELQVAVPSALHRELPLPLEEVEVASVQVPPLLAGSNKMGVFYSAVLLSRVEKLRKLLDYCDLSLVDLKITPLSLAAEFCLNRKPATDEVYGLVHVGFERTLVVVCKGGFPYFARDFALAGKHFTYAFQMASQIPWQKAEEFKLNYEITEKDFMIEPFMLDWTDEISRSLEFYAREHPDCGIPKVLYLSGGSAAWSGLAARLQQSVRTRVITDSWSSLEPADKSPARGDSMSYKLAIGLSLTSQELKAWLPG